MLAEQSDKETAKAIKTKRARIAALDDLMSKAYEDKLLGKMPEELCMKFIDRYLAEQENLQKEVSMLEVELRNAIRLFGKHRVSPDKPFTNTLFVLGYDFRFRSYIVEYDFYESRPR